MFEQLLAEVFKRLNSSRRAVFKQVFEQRLNVKPAALGAPLRPAPEVEGG